MFYDRKKAWGQNDPQCTPRVKTPQKMSLTIFHMMLDIKCKTTYQDNP